MTSRKVIYSNDSHSHFLHIFLHYNSFMSKMEPINKFIKNARINNKQLKKICYFFAYDFTATQTAKELSLSRQTINSYFKMMREFLLSNQDNIDYKLLNKNLKKNFFLIKYINLNSNIIYYIEYKNLYFIIEDKYLKEISHFINTKIQNKLISYKKINTARVLYDEEEQEYFISTYMHTHNQLEKHIIERLKKFRGINKNNSMLHLQESLIRYNYNKEFLYNSLSLIFK